MNLILYPLYPSYETYSLRLHLKSRGVKKSSNFQAKRYVFVTFGRKTRYGPKDEMPNWRRKLPTHKFYDFVTLWRWIL
jgi:hypothetical protein